jgi:hypothetical protein
MRVKYRAFLSYSRAESSVARRLTRCLKRFHIESLSKSWEISYRARCFNILAAANPCHSITMSGLVPPSGSCDSALREGTKVV